MEKRIFQLADPEFRIRAAGGVLISIMPGRGDTQYIQPGEAFGGFVLSWEQDGESGHWETGENTPPTEEHFSRRGVLLRYTADWNELAVPLRRQAAYTLKEGSLLYELILENVSDRALTLTDVGFSFPCSNQVQWGETAGGKVMGHHFISGHGSHLLFQRRDGQGPILAVIPQEGLWLEHFRAAPVYTVYAHSAGVRRGEQKPGAWLALGPTEKRLGPGERRRFVLRYEFAADQAAVRELFVKRGLVDVQVFPGLTVPKGEELYLSMDSQWSDLRICPDERVEILSQKRENCRLTACMRLIKPGEAPVRIEFGGGRFFYVTFFATQPLGTLLEKRAAFIAKCQHLDQKKWYYGLISEWNNETGVLLGPDRYDRIGGWRVYEVSCDDPGLAKPAFLSAKLAVLPDREQARALDLYVENFVWGGLQCTEEEPYPYAIYGIPDWKQNRESADRDVKGRLHLWRIYDYPHVALMYYNLYCMARDYPDLPLSRAPETYLLRASGTACAMFTVPLELDGWSAYKTGIYNELVIEDILAALRAEGMEDDYQRLLRHWTRKARFFALECMDLFGSEYPFDTTGFESTHALGRWALNHAEEIERESYFDPPLTLEKAWSFLESQMRCNRACRGELEPAYYWYGSDYRGSNAGYTLSYMSQMGGWALVDYALYVAADPYPLLRLGCGALLSSWALMNAGDAAEGWGYWFPGREHDGAACGGFEPQTAGTTWLDQPHHGGPWYYSCEIDLGYCGYLRGAALILVQDPLFGAVCFGGRMDRGKAVSLTPRDGVGRRFHYVGPEGRIHLLLDGGHFTAVKVSAEQKQIICTIDAGSLARSAALSAETAGLSGWNLTASGRSLREQEEKARISLPPGVTEVVVWFSGENTMKTE